MLIVLLFDVSVRCKLKCSELASVSSLLHLDSPSSTISSYLSCSVQSECNENRGWLKSLTISPPLYPRSKCHLRNALSSSFTLFVEPIRLARVIVSIRVGTLYLMVCFVPNVCCEEAIVVSSPLPFAGVKEFSFSRRTRLVYNDAPATEAATAETNTKVLRRCDG